MIGERDADSSDHRAVGIRAVDGKAGIARAHLFPARLPLARTPGDTFGAACSAITTQRQTLAPSNIQTAYNNAVEAAKLDDAAILQQRRRSGRAPTSRSTRAGRGARRARRAGLTGASTKGRAGLGHNDGSAEFRPGLRPPEVLANARQVVAWLCVIGAARLMLIAASRAAWSRPRGTDRWDPRSTQEAAYEDRPDYRPRSLDDRGLG